MLDFSNQTRTGQVGKKRIFNGSWCNAEEKHPTNNITVLEPQDQEIVEFDAIQERFFFSLVVFILLNCLLFLATNQTIRSIKILHFFLAYSSFISTHSFSGKGTLMLCGAALSIRRARQDADSALLNAMVIRENSSGTQEPTCELGYIPCNPLPYDATMIKTGETHYHLGPGKGYFISPCSSSHVST